MTLHDIDPFIKALVALGYKRETNPMAVGRATYQYWKAAWSTGEYRDYTVVITLYDRSGYPGYNAAKYGRWGLEYRMTVNHQTNVDVDLLTMDVLHESMTVEQWEQRCAAVYAAVVTSFKKA